MAKVRKDLRGRSLRKGEVQRSSIKDTCTPIQICQWEDVNLYMLTIWQKSSRKEAKLMKDQFRRIGSLCCWQGKCE